MTPQDDQRDEAGLSSGSIGTDLVDLVVPRRHSAMIRPHRPRGLP